MKKPFRNHYLQDLEEKLSEFERKIQEEDYDQYEPGFDEEFSDVSNDVESLRIEFFIEEQGVDVNYFKKRLNGIRNRLDSGDYDSEAELDMMFPNGDE